MLRTIARSLSSGLGFVKLHARRFLPQKEAVRLSQRPRFRPRLEILEDRIVPATYTDYWYGTVSSDGSNVSNWTTDGGQHVVPDQNGNVVFGTFGITPKDCTMNVTGGTTINSLLIACSRP